MADQHRWFKLWCTAPDDDDLQALSPALRWAWAALGCYVKVHGTHGNVKISMSNAVLAAQMGIPTEQLFAVTTQLPHLHVEEVKNRHGEFTVTFHNWVKYQEDSTQAERQRASRSKRRGEEKRIRGEEKRERSPRTPFHPPTPTEVSQYATRLGFVLDGERFCNYYASKGWVVGKSPMKDWQAAVRTWKQRHLEPKGAPHVPPRSLTPSAIFQLERERAKRTRSAAAAASAGSGNIPTAPAPNPSGDRIP